MPASLDHITADTPMGVNLIADGATFRVWAPQADRVYVRASFNDWHADDASLLTNDGGGHWRGFVRGVQDRDHYKFFVVNGTREGWKRDPYARELTNDDKMECLVRSTDFPWHDTGFVTPQFHNFVVYQLHVGAFYAPRAPKTPGTFLDVVDKIPHLAELGVTALQLMPVVEFPGSFSLGYNGTDYFSPEMAFGVADADLTPYLARCNQLLAAKQLTPYSAESMRGEMNQLKALIDLCHAYDLAVILDVVYNHAGGGFGEESIEYFDLQEHDRLYFNDGEWAGGRVFDFGDPNVRQFLINNAKFFLDEYRVDGFRYDEVSVIDREGRPDGWSFCQDLTSTLRAYRPSAVQHAEYWPVNPWIVRDRNAGGAGFHTTLTDGLRKAIRHTLAQASFPGDGPLDMQGLAANLVPDGFDAKWRCIQGPENHDVVMRPKDADDHGREERIARVADPSDPRSWWGRSRSRVATGLSLTAPGIPMLFMGQEFLEDKQWSDDISGHPELLLHWQGLEHGDKQMLDHLRFTRELIHLRQQYPALRGEGFRVTHRDDADRVLVFQRWVPGAGEDVLVIVSLANFTRSGYRVGFPGGGTWREVFNSDVYENWVNPNVAGNGSQVFADPQPLHEFTHSAALVLPANALLVFAR